MTAALPLTPPIHAIRSGRIGPVALLRAMRGNALAMWDRRAYEQPAVIGNLLGRVQVLLNDPEALHHVLVRNAGNYRRPALSHRLLRPILGEGLLLAEGAAWRHQRRTIAPIFSPRAMPMLARHIAVTAQDVRARLAAAGPVDLLPEMQRTALDIAGRSMFSLEVAAYGPGLRTLMTRFGLEMARPSVFDLLLPLSVPTPGDGPRRRFRAEWLALIGAILEARSRQPETDGPRDLFDMLRAARDPETGEGFTQAQLCDQVATMILAGHETTALTLFWSMALLAQAPDWQDRVAAEAAAADLSPDAAAAALEALPVTKAVISEALRLYPPAFIVTREAIARDRANTTLVPRGATVSIAPFVLHRHARLWQDPHSFDPARFLPGAPPPPRFAYLPFGAGPRVCVGAQFAMAEATLVLATLVAAFRISSPDAAGLRPVGRVTTQPDRTAYFTFAPRG